MLVQESCAQQSRWKGVNPPAGREPPSLRFPTPAGLGTWRSNVPNPPEVRGRCMYYMFRIGGQPPDVHRVS